MTNKKATSKNTSKTPKIQPTTPNPVGRPPKYKTAEELQTKISEYFKSGHRSRTVTDKEGFPVKVPILTITGLVHYCGFCDRHSFYDLEKQDKFSHTIKQARSFIEQEYEEMLQRGLGAGAIFALKNFGWSDKSEVEVSGDINVNRVTFK